MPPKHELHTIRTDVLLWALGGMDDARLPDKGYYYPAGLIREIMRIAAKPRAKRGEVKLLAERWGRPVKSLHVKVHHVRTGRTPGNWPERLK